jgi:spore germination protein GerM
MPVVVAMLVAACGVGGPDVSPTATTGLSTTVPATTEPSADPATTTAPGPSTTTSPDPASTVPAPDLAISAWYLIDEAGQEGRPGPFLVPVSRGISYTSATAAAAMRALIGGPTVDESAAAPPLSSMIPEGSRFHDVTVEGGMATVDVDAAFGLADHSAAAAVRVAQVVFTLTQFPTIREVRFLEDGSPVDVQTSQGDLVGRPVNRADYRDLQAIVSVDKPAYGGPGANPLRVTGEAAVFEATFAYALTDKDGSILAEGHAMTAEGNTWAPFDFTIEYVVDEPQLGALIVWVDSAKDGSPVNVREYPLKLQP